MPTTKNPIKLNAIQKSLLRMAGGRGWIYGRHTTASINRRAVSAGPESVMGLSAVMNVFQSYTRLSHDRRVRYADYDGMDESSPLVAGALSLYASEVTAEDPHHKRVIWAESADPDLNKLLNRFLARMNMDERVWGMSRNLAKYGDIFFVNLFDDSGGSTKPSLRTIRWLHPTRVDRIEDLSLVGFKCDDLVDIIEPMNAGNLYRPWDFSHGRILCYDSEDIYGRCYSSDTEILTRRGWLRFPDLLPTDEVATRNPETKAFEWQRPTEHVNQPYSGKMCRFKSRSLDLLVTPNHRMLLDSMPTSANGGVKSKVGGECIVKARDLLLGYNPKNKIPMTSCWQGTELREKRFEPVPAVVTRGQSGGPDVTYTHPGPTAMTMTGDDYCALMGAYLAEGNVRADGGIEVAQLPSSKGFAAYGALFSRLSGGPAQYNGRAFVLPRRVLTDHFRQFGHAPEKFVPEDVMNATPAQLRLFWDHFVLGDGYFPERRAKSSRGRQDGEPLQSITTTSKRLADQLVEVAQKLGWSASVTAYAPESHSINEDGKTREISGKHTQYVVRVRYSKAMGFNLTEETYTGTVHCVTVPNGIVYVRRNGYPAWCGNSMIEEIRYIWKMMQILETMVAIAHVQRAVDRTMYTIDVTGLSEEEQEARVRMWKTMLKKKEFFDPATQAFKSDFNPMTFQEDVFLPKTADDVSSVDTFPGRDIPQSLADDLNYFKDNMCAGLGVPRDYLDGTQSRGAFDSKAALVLQDVHFARKMVRLQRGVKNLVKWICEAYVLGEYGDRLKDGKLPAFDIKMGTLSQIQDALNEERWLKKAEVCQNLASLADTMGWDRGVWTEFLVDEVLKDISPALKKKLILPPKQPVGGNDQNGEGGGETGAPPAIPPSATSDGLGLSPGDLTPHQGPETTRLLSWVESDGLDMSKVKQEFARIKGKIVEHYPELGSLARSLVVKEDRTESED